VLLIRLEDIQRVYLEDCLASKVLINFNWNISLVLSADTINACAEPILTLECVLAADAYQQEKVLLEFTSAKLEETLILLNEIKSQADSYGS